MRMREGRGVSWLAAKLPGAEVAFTTRLGGESSPPFDSLNLGFHTGDNPDHVAANRRLLCAALGIEIDKVLSARQVHGAELQVHDDVPENPFFAGGSERLRRSATAGVETEAIPTADGQIAVRPGLVPLVLVADCLPVALIGSGEAGPPPLAMLHCGWRPLVAGIVARGVAATGAVAAAIGPGIGPCCFEVGAEVHAAFAALELGPGLKHGRNLDLPEITERLLRRAGVEHVQQAGICTRCDADRFFSHRRDGDGAGRQAGLAWATCND